MLVAHVEQTARSGILRHTGRLQQHAFDRRIGALRQGLDELVGLSIRRCPDRGVEIAARLIKTVVLLCQDFGRRNRRHSCWCWCYTCWGWCYTARHGTRLRLRLFRAVDDNLRQLHFPAGRRGWLSAGLLGAWLLGARLLCARRLCARRLFAGLRSGLSPGLIARLRVREWIEPDQRDERHGACNRRAREPMIPIPHDTQLANTSNGQTAGATSTRAVATNRVTRRLENAAFAFHRRRAAELATQSAISPTQLSRGWSARAE